MRKYADSNVPERVYQAWMDFLDLETDSLNENLRMSILWFGAENWEPVRWNNDIKTLFLLPQNENSIGPYSPKNIGLLNCFNQWMRQELGERKFSVAFFKWNN